MDFECPDFICRYRAVEVPSIPGNSRRVSLVPHFASSPMDRIQEELYAVPGPNEHEDQEVGNVK